MGISIIFSQSHASGQNSSIDMEYHNNRPRKISTIQNGESANDDTIMVNGKVYDKRTLGLKNPYGAVLMATTFGLWVHGAGHFYAGRSDIGWLLLGTEVISTGGIALLGISTTKNKEDQAVGNVIAYGLLICWVGSWIFDIIHAPIACIKENKKTIEDLSIQPFMNGDKLTYKIGLSFNCRLNL